MDDKKFLEELVASGAVDRASGERLLAEAVVTNRRLEELLAERNFLDEVGLAQMKSRLLNVPYKKIDSDQVGEDVLKFIPEETAINYQAVPLARESNLLIVGMVHPDNQTAQDALRYIAKQNRVSLGVYLITPADLTSVLRKYSPLNSQIQQAVRSLNIRSFKGAGVTRVVPLEEETMAAAEEAPIIKIVASLLKEAVKINASDIHVEPQRTRLRIRFRVDGLLHDKTSLPIELQQPVVSRIKVLSNLKIDETRIPQDGRFRTVIFGKDIDFRVSTFPTPSGEKAALRVLDPTVGLKKLDQLGLVGRNLDLVKQGIEKPFGMVLISGPTGSGKTTTLYALLQILNRENVNIISLEDPVEYTIEGVNQSQVRPDIGYDFASGLRQILRQDPDVIMVGEIRDRETAGLAVNAALTGHMVLSTLHTNNAVGVIPRLLDLKVEAFLLPSSLNLMVAQRLVSQLCQKCKKSQDPLPEITDIVRKELGEKAPATFKVYQPAGCPACSNRGSSGRIALFEILAMTPQLTEILSTPFNENRLWEEARRQGMLTLRQDGLLKALDGLVSIEEVFRETAEDYGILTS